jgi:hypothetical protein
MSELPHDDMERDGKLTALYRAAGEEAPPAALDDAILAAAHRAVGARPRPAGFAFGHAWRVPLSIAAVLVLSVSLVTVMREEAPELTEAPYAEPPAAKVEPKPVAAADAGTALSAPGFVPDEQRSKSIGLKAPASSTAVGMRQPESGDRAAPSRKEKTADPLVAETATVQELAKRRDAPAVVIAQSERGLAPAAPPASEAARSNAPKDSRLQPPTASAPAANVVEKKAQVPGETAAPARAERESRFREAPAPAPAPAQVLDKAAAAAQSGPSADMRQAAPARAAPRAEGVMGKLESDAGLPPEKWLERIEELRKQGKFEEAKASLAEFRKRYPDYQLPDALRAWSNP